MSGCRVGEGALDLARLEVEDAEGAVAVADHCATAVGQQFGALGPLAVTCSFKVTKNKRSMALQPDILNEISFYSSKLVHIRGRCNIDVSRRFNKSST